MDQGHKRALQYCHQGLRNEILVKTILPNLRWYLTDVEYLQVQDHPDNVAQVDELLTILLTKEKSYFDEFCHVLECNGYEHWAQQLIAAASGHREAESKCSDYRSVWGGCGWVRVSCIVFP